MLAGFKQISSQEVNATSTTQRHELGSIGATADGRIFRYVLNGGVALSAGKLTAAQAKVANHTNITAAAAAAVGDKVITATLGATAATADQYRDGYLVVVDVAGTGQALRIAGNSAASSSGTVTVYLQDPLNTALTTSSKVSLVYNPWSGVVISPSATGVAQVATGVPQLAVAASAYAWVQTGGLASVLSDGIITKGAGGIISDAVDGAVEIEVAATVTQRVSYAPEATVDTKYYPQYLTLDR